jgi:hypothetical protein
MQAQAVIAAKPSVDPFAPSRVRFDDIASKLSSSTMLRMTHSAVERRLASEGRDLLRQLYQDHLDLRGPGEVATLAVVGADGVRRTQRRVRARNQLSLFGEVRIGRMGYGQDGVESLHPLDAELNLPDDKYSLGVRRRVAEAAAKESFDEVVADVERDVGTAVPKRQAEELAVRAAQDFDAFYEAREAQARAAESGPILVISTDGKGVRMRKEDLRPATRKVAANRRHRLRGRLAPGEKRGQKRMAQVAAVYTIAPFVRRPEDIVQELAPDHGAAARRPAPEAKRVWASLLAEPDEVIDAAFREALRRDPEQRKRWVVLCDGNETQLMDLCRAELRHAADVVIILDIIHVGEYLWKAAPAFHSAATPEAEAWVRERLLAVLRGKAVHVAAGIRRSATLQRLSAAERAPVDDCADYLLKYAAFMRYDEYLAAGLPIATGVIEGACRHLVKDRMDLTGASWRLPRAEAVLRLRSLRASGDFDDYWVFHEEREYGRNHAARYAGAVPAVLKPSRTRTDGRSHLRLVP